eukprot:TRINITY_DN10963_c0_g1_i1.p1 TRINITY_DN10963_c0_g1~~TRINITY_DN10963_c0_g1_i1.p1  ORF type:complete len:207 (+),score=18.65 TRINITY_DN10963_c0_g1_i1:36-656(+)
MSIYLLDEFDISVINEDNIKLGEVSYVNKIKGGGCRNLTLDDKSIHLVFYCTVKYIHTLNKKVLMSLPENSYQKLLEISNILSDSVNFNIRPLVFAGKTGEYLMLGRLITSSVGIVYTKLFLQNAEDETSIDNWPNSFTGTVSVRVNGLYFTDSVHRKTGNVMFSLSVEEFLVEDVIEPATRVGTSKIRRLFDKKKKDNSNPNNYW